MIEQYLTEKDQQQLSSLGINDKTVAVQISNFEKGFPFSEIVKPCTIGNGIEKLSEDEVKQLCDSYDTKSTNYSIIKFVPASGAASRMFKNLFDFASSKDPDHSARKTMSNIEKFAFIDELQAIRSQNNKSDLDKEIAAADYILNSHGLNYGHLPKGLITFHKYDGTTRTAFEEHLVEGIHYAQNKERVVQLHFTVSPEHLDQIEAHLNQKVPIYEKEFNVKFDISYSTQSPSTDTIAVNMDNTPFRNEDGTLLFRPGGHGALLQNLNNIKADIVFIKNIDNVVPDRIKSTTYEYKKSLGSLLMKIKEERDQILSDSMAQSNIAEKASHFLETRIGIADKTFSSNEEAYNYLNRPIRVCGMVKNEGEPGGGPFWVKGQTGNISQQIVETSQIDTNNPAQKAILDSSSHFNPVDLICAITDHNGNKYDLSQFSDPSTGFISYKSKDGKELKAQELPGLWNGAMANWLTVFVEVPAITFNPVKTIDDLLRPQHQPK